VIRAFVRFVLGAALASSCVVPAFADPPSGAIGLTLNPVVGGFHESFDDIVHLPPIPVPLIEGNYRVSNVEIAGYGLPPTVAIPYTDAIQGSTALRLSILDATFRVWEPSNHFAVGVGETVYNQTTHYATADIFVTGGGERQYSRIAGAHYEVAMHMPFRSGRFEASVRYAPVLLGTQVSTYDDGAPSRFDPERAEQIDTDVRYVHRAGAHTDAVLGVRYVNFTAAYDVPGKPLSDRNCALLPSFGYLWRL
jgi:hypothetical protein